MDTANATLKVLLVEDSPSDAELVLRSLRELPHDIDHARVSSEAGLRSALAAFAPDIILSDFSMPGFSGQQALVVARQEAAHVPFLFVSGTIGEELAIEALQRGALDYVLKDNLRRLPSAVERALRMNRERLALERTEQALRESEERFRTIVENSRDWIWETDAGLITTYSNHAVEQILGYRPEEILGTRATDLLIDEERDGVIRRIDELRGRGSGWQRWRVKCRHRDGSIRILDSSSTPAVDATGAVIGFRGVVQDVTELLQQQTRIEQLARIQAVLGALGNTVLRARDQEALLISTCRVAVEQGGFIAAAIGVRRPDDTLEVVARCGDSGVLKIAAPFEPIPINAPGPYYRHPGIVAFREKRRVAIQDFASIDLPASVREEMAAIGVRSEIALPIGAEPWGLLALFSNAPQDYDAQEIDLLERLTGEIDYAMDFMEKSQRLQHLAYHNSVTDLPNRAAFRDRVAPLLRTGPVLVAALDIQRFSHINDSRGRAFGDKLLRQVGLRLGELMPDGIVANPEADTYLVAFPSSKPRESEVDSIEGQLRELEECAFQVDNEKTYVILQCGLAMSPVHGTDGEALERNAMAALAEGAKRKVRVHAFSEDLRGRAANRMELERDLRHAIESNQFELHFQPKFDAISRRLIGAEALLRWRHPQRGMMSPADFIPVLEETGLIVPVGAWVMQSALETAVAWRARCGWSLRIAVNVSARELRHAHFLDRCRALLEPHLADPLLDIEITESLVMDDLQHSMQVLEGVRRLGCRVSIDDFGTGYSSLNYLARLPVDEIKIDQSFVALLAHSPESMGLVTNIISLAHSLSLKVVAEGVEEEEQAKLLRLLRCDILQGYLLGRPVNAQAFEELHPSGDVSAMERLRD
jgi:PAS domain S-box-containing protein